MRRIQFWAKQLAIIEAIMWHDQIFQCIAGSTSTHDAINELEYTMPHVGWDDWEYQINNYTYVWNKTMLCISKNLADQHEMSDEVNIINLGRLTSSRERKWKDQHQNSSKTIVMFVSRKNCRVHGNHTLWWVQSLILKPSAHLIWEIRGERLPIVQRNSFLSISSMPLEVIELIGTPSLGFTVRTSKRLSAQAVKGCKVISCWQDRRRPSMTVLWLRMGWLVLYGQFAKKLQWSSRQQVHTEIQSTTQWWYTIS